MIKGFGHDRECLIKKPTASPDTSSSAPKEGATFIHGPGVVFTE
jgi:hypothetical protein